jgi:hypothetical protein
MRRWYYLKIGNKLYEFFNRNKLRTYYIPNYVFIVWYSEKPIKLKDLMKTRYIKFPPCE